MNIILRDYQKECVDIVNQIGKGSYLVCMATGLGKTATFSQFKRQGRTLVLAHREELVNQPVKYFNCSVGKEMAKEKSNGEDVVIASVQSLVRRLDKFNPNAFDRIITDEAHHGTANSYRKIYDYFNFRQHIGVTATPNRHDKTGLEKIFERIIFERDIKWAIQSKYLCDIKCVRAKINYDLSRVSTRLGDYANNELSEAMSETAESIAEVYHEQAKGQTLIFATSVEHCYQMAEHIDGAVVVEANTKDRTEIIERFTNREIPCLINCMIFTEGTDIPLIETIIMARPTKNLSLYTQMVGRGLRLYEGKEKLLLIDCVGVSDNNLCTAPSLIGVDIQHLPSKSRDEIEGDLFDLEDIAKEKSDVPENWIINTYHVDIWAKGQGYNTHDVNYFKLPNGDFICQLPDRIKFKIPAQDDLGFTNLFGEKIPMQQAFDRLFIKLRNEYEDSRAIWDLSIAKRWGSSPATEKQLKLINRKLKGRDLGNLNKLQAVQILNRLFSK